MLNHCGTCRLETKRLILRRFTVADADANSCILLDQRTDLPIYTRERNSLPDHCPSRGIYVHVRALPSANSNVN